MKTFKYKTSFSSESFSLLEDDQIKSCISNASIDSLKSTKLPDTLDLENNFDILGTVFNAAVVNQINRNGDGIDTNTAMSIARHFIHKPQNLEHKRSRIVGCNVGYAWSELDSNNILTDADVEGRDDAFNLVLVGAVWKSIDPKFASLLLEAGDPDSDKYMKISTSWELGFDDYVILKGSDIVAEGTIIDDDAEIQRLTPYLKPEGGDGFDPDDGEKIGRLIVGDIGSVLPYGIGYTTKPAAHVEGVAILDSENEEVDVEDVDAQEVEDFQNKLAASIKKVNKNTSDCSQNNKKTVTLNNEEKSIIMKIKKVQDIVDLLPEESQASASEFIAEQIKMKSDEFDKAVREKDEALEQANARSEQLENDVKAMKDMLDNMKAQSDAKEAEALFNERMSSLNDEFELSEPDLKIVASEIRGLDDEGFKSWYDRFSVLAAAKNKENIKKQKEELQASIQDAIEKAKKEQESAASTVQEETDTTSTSDASAEELNEVEEELENIQEDKGQEIANASSGEELSADWSKAFGDNVLVNGQKLNK